MSIEEIIEKEGDYLSYTHTCKNGYEVRCEIIRSPIFKTLNGYIFIHKESIYYEKFHELPVYSGVTYKAYIDDYVKIGFYTINSSINKIGSGDIDFNMYPNIEDYQDINFVKDKIGYICEELSSDKRIVRKQKIKKIING
jgi:hypothetical protein